ncbi:hypothetical protein Golob_006692 [Gossypium lobatum]|uniref:S-protein homolog n=1 Tax=Gossypium lobatum TaxID=34289 RepID=A0A7J8MX35_9ROSI|nr:hypothetical protein [Gossypium lobatum]
MPPLTSTILLLPLLLASNYHTILLPSILLHRNLIEMHCYYRIDGGELMEAEWCNGWKQGAKVEEEQWK